MAHNKVVWILGAGASAEAGAPLMNNFLIRARSLYDDRESGLSDPERQRFQNVFEYRERLTRALRKINTDLENIETLFGVVDMAHHLGKGSTLRADVIYMILKTLHLCREAEQTRQGQTNESRPVDGARFHSCSWRPRQNYMYTHEVFVNSLTKRFPGHQGETHTILTLNYDVILDRAMEDTGIGLDYAFLEDDTTYYENELREGRGKQPLPAKDAPRLLKLHGSANWLRCPKREPHHHALRVLWPHNAGPSLESDAEQRAACACDQRYERLIVPPTWNKGEYSYVFRHIWGQAAQALQEARYIVVVGYSMPRTDTFFEHLLTISLAENAGLAKFIVIDPGEDTLRRYADLIAPFFARESFAPCQCDFNHFVWHHFQSGFDSLVRWTHEDSQHAFSP